MNISGADGITATGAEAVSRADLAKALTLGARVPQYLPGQPNYRDVKDAVTMIFVESAQASPNGSLFVDATPGGNFRPNDPVSRLTAVVALVRAAGFRAEAEARPEPTWHSAQGSSHLLLSLTIAVAVQEKRAQRGRPKRAKGNRFKRQIHSNRATGVFMLTASGTNWRFRLGRRFGDVSTKSSACW